MDDYELLQSYASCRAEDAFRSLTERYVNLVYSAATRQTGSPEAAKDVSQAVFLTLAQKAGTISRKTILAGWLLRTTRYAAANARRLEQRRQHYEQEAMQSYVQLAGADPTWQRLAPLLDEAMDCLGEKDRDAVVLRFFEQLPLKYVAEKLGVSEDGAQKRVSRAIEKLRLFFARHGRIVSAGAVISTLAANSVQAAPAALASAICAAVFASSISSGSFAVTIGHATLRTLARAKARMVVVRAGSVSILLGLIFLILIRSGKLSPDNLTPAAPPPIAAQEKLKPQVQSLVVAATADTIAEPPEMRQLVLRVLDAQTEAPVANARLTLVSTTASSQRSTNTFTTDAQGEGLISYSPAPVKWWSHRIEIFRDGYVPKYVSWSEFQQDHIYEIPSNYTAKLDPAVTIGGAVVDEQDAPVSGVRVVFSVSGPTSSRARERLTMMGNYHAEGSGLDGKWACSHVPRRFGMIDFKLVHPLFQEKTFVSDSPDAPAYINVERIPEADFLAGRAMMKLRPGLAIAGIVTEESGRPVPGAKVTQNFDFRQPERNMMTDANGFFRFGNGRQISLSLTVQAAGLAPVVTSLVLNASADDLRLVLPTGRALRGRVVDETGEPIFGATIEAASPSADSRTLFEWHTKTDADGKFSWDTAPAVQEYAVSASGYESLSRIQLSADNSEQPVRLTKKSSPVAVRIYGQILDAENKQPPASARVQIWETQKEPGRGFFTFTTVPEDVSADGRFRLKTSSGTVSYILEAQADGYWPLRLTNQVTGEREVQLNIVLVKAPLAAGIVVTPTGEPAAGATLIVCGHNEQASMLHSGGFQIGSRGTGVASALSDKHGRFRLPSTIAPEVAVVAHPEGFGEVPFSQVNSNTVITLQPWGRIEGTAQLGGKPLANETIRLISMLWRMNQSPRVTLYLGATTDADGRFSFDGIPPGEWEVQHELNKRADGTVGVHFPAFSHGVSVAVRSGETATIALGGGGRTVIGRAVAPNTLGANVWTENSVALILKVPTPDVPKPLRPDAFQSDKEFQSANNSYLERSVEYWSSEKGRALQRRQREYRGMFASDGSFRIDDVPPGDYTLKINLIEPPKASEGNPLNFAAIASLEKDASIPAVLSQPDNGPVNLGVIQLLPVEPLRSRN